MVKNNLTFAAKSVLSGQKQGKQRFNFKALKISLYPSKPNLHMQLCIAWVSWGGGGGYLVLGNGLHVLANELQDCIHSLIGLFLLWGG